MIPRDEQDKWYREARRRWGIESELNQLVEECGEIIVARSHLNRGRCDIHGLVEELADVLLQIRSLQTNLKDEYGYDIVEEAFEKKFEKFKGKFEADTGANR